MLRRNLVSIKLTDSRSSEEGAYNLFFYFYIDKELSLSADKERHQLELKEIALALQKLSADKNLHLGSSGVTVRAIQRTEHHRHYILERNGLLEIYTDLPIPKADLQRLKIYHTADGQPSSGLDTNPAALDFTFIEKILDEKKRRPILFKIKLPPPPVAFNTAEEQKEVSLNSEQRQEAFLLFPNYKNKILTSLDALNAFPAQLETKINVNNKRALALEEKIQAETKTATTETLAEWTDANTNIDSLKQKIATHTLTLQETKKTVAASTHLQKEAFNGLTFNYSNFKMTEKLISPVAQEIQLSIYEYLQNLLYEWSSELTVAEINKFNARFANLAELKSQGIDFQKNENAHLKVPVGRLELHLLFLGHKSLNDIAEYVNKTIETCNSFKRLGRRPSSLISLIDNHLAPLQKSADYKDSFSLYNSSEKKEKFTWDDKVLAQHNFAFDFNASHKAITTIHEKINLFDQVIEETVTAELPLLETKFDKLQKETEAQKKTIEAAKLEIKKISQEATVVLSTAKKNYIEKQELVSQAKNIAANLKQDITPLHNDLETLGNYVVNIKQQDTTLKNNKECVAITKSFKEAEILLTESRNVSTQLKTTTALFDTKAKSIQETYLALKKQEEALQRQQEEQARAAAAAAAKRQRDEETQRRLADEEEATEQARLQRLADEDKARAQQLQAQQAFEARVIDIANKIILLLSDVKFWHAQLHWLGGGTPVPFNGESVKVPQSAAEKIFLKNNLPNVLNFEQAHKFIIDSKKSAAEAETRGEWKCCFHVRSTPTALMNSFIAAIDFSQLMSSEAVDNYLNAINKNWRTPQPQHPLKERLLSKISPRVGIT